MGMSELSKLTIRDALPFSVRVLDREVAQDEHAVEWLDEDLDLKWLY